MTVITQQYAARHHTIQQFAARRHKTQQFAARRYSILLGGTKNRLQSWDRSGLLQKAHHNTAAMLLPFAGEQSVPSVQDVLCSAQSNKRNYLKELLCM
jgi:hypothetical protein